MWSGCYASQWDRVVVIVCIALHGYHGSVTYAWHLNGQLMEDEVFAIVYNNKPGVYEATVTFGEKSLTKRFKLEGLNRIFCSIIYLTLFYCDG